MHYKRFFGVERLLTIRILALGNFVTQRSMSFEIAFTGELFSTKRIIAFESVVFVLNQNMLNKLVFENVRFITVRIVAVESDINIL